MLSRRQHAAIARRVGCWRAHAIAWFVEAGQRLGSAANRAQIVDLDFDVSPYLTQLEERRCENHRPLLRSWLTAAASANLLPPPEQDSDQGRADRDRERGHVRLRDVPALRPQLRELRSGNKETAEKGRKDADAAVQSGAAISASPPRRRSISASISILPRPGQCAIPAARIWPSIEAYFDQVNEVFAQHPGRSASMAPA